MPRRLRYWQRPLPGLLLLSATACASSGGTASSALPPWTSYLGAYRFSARISELSHQLEGDLVMHDTTSFSLEYRMNADRGSCADMSTETRARQGTATLRGNRLRLRCDDLELEVRRDIDGLEGVATYAWIQMIQRTTCVSYGTSSTGQRICLRTETREHPRERRSRGALRLVRAP